MPSVLCPSCSKKYRVDDSAAGKKFACKQCGSIVRVPALSVTAVPVAAVSKPAPKPAPAPVARTRTAPPPPPQLLETEYNTEDDTQDHAECNSGDNASGELDFNDMASLESTGEVDNSIPILDESPAPTYRGTRATLKPTPAKKSWSPPRVGFRLNRGVLVVVALGIGAMVWGGKEWLLASSASDTPQEMTCADLGMNGPGSNAHVRVTNFNPTSGYVAWKTQTGELQTMWYPIVPPDAFKIPEGKKLKDGSRIVPDNIVDSGKVHVLVKTHKAKSESDVEGIMNRDTVEGLVINKIESLTQKERDLLHEKYPAMSEENCYIVEDGRQSQGGMGIFAALGGALLALYGLFLMFKPAT